MSVPHAHTAVLGAGVCGLAAAWELLRSGAAERVTVLESEDRAGGMARSVYDPSGLRSDLGPHRIHTELPEIEQLLGDLIADEMVWVTRKSAMYVEGRFVDYPLSLGTVLKLYGPLELGLMAASAATAKASGLFNGHARNFAEYMKRSFGPRLYHRVLEPYSAKVWKLPPEEISVEAAKVRVSAGSMGKLARRVLAGGKEKAGAETALKHFRTIKGGVEALVHRLEAKVREHGGVILCGQPVERLEWDGAEWSVTHAGTRTQATSVISTLPLPILAQVAGGVPNALDPADVGQLEYLSISLVFLVIQKPFVSDNHWLYFPTPDLIFNRGYEPKRFWTDANTPTDETLLCLEITARPGTDLYAASDDQLIAATVRDLAKTQLVQPAEIGKSFVVRLPFGYPLYHTAVDLHLRRVFDDLSTWPHLLTTGRQGLFSHNNMDHSMFMGLEAARALAAGPEAEKHWYREGAHRLRHFRIVD